MRWVRTVGSAFLVLLGAMVVVAWGLALTSVNTIKDGTAAETITTRVLSDPQVASLAAQTLQDQISAQLEDSTAGTVFDLLEQPLHDILVDVLTSDFVVDTTSAGVDRLSNRVVAEITDPDRPYGAFGLEVDLSERVNARIDEIPVIGLLVPDLELPTVEYELIDADTFEAVRNSYQALEFAATWFLWIGLGLMALGVLVSRRRRWYFTKAFVFLGVLGLAIAFTVSTLGPRTVAGLVPGGREGGAGTLVEDFMSDTAVAPIVNVLLTLGVVALALAGLFAAVARYVPMRRASAAAPAPTGDGEVASAGSAAIDAGPDPAAAPAATPTSATAKRPAPKKPAANKPAAKKPAAKKPAAKKPAAKKPAAKKPAAKKPAAKKPAAKKPAPKKPSSD